MRKSLLLSALLLMGCQPDYYEVVKDGNTEKIIPRYIQYEDTSLRCSQWGCTMWGYWCEPPPPNSPRCSLTEKGKHGEDGYEVWRKGANGFTDLPYPCSHVLQENGSYVCLDPSNT